MCEVDTVGSQGGRLSGECIIYVKDLEMRECVGVKSEEEVYYQMVSGEGMGDVECEGRK